MSKRDLLERANDHYFSTGLGDGASCLCRANMQYGLAKIHVVQERFGLDPDAIFISSPDETVTRNVNRWKAGFGYGGRLVWGSGKEKLIILDTMPNACGMLVGGLDELPEIRQLLQHIKDLQNIYVDDVKIEWDYYRGNHFIDLFKIVNQSPDHNLPEYAFIVHGSVSELRGETEKGLGLYLEKSKSLKERSTLVETKFGPLHVLLDSDAEEYFSFFKYAEFLAEEKRKEIAKEIFGRFTEVCNIAHQLLLNYNVLLLGCHDTKSQDACVFPIALRADLPAFLMKGIDNLKDDTMEILGFRKRAERLGVIDTLANANILPHGGGYAFNDFVGVKDVMEIDGERYFVLDMKSGMGNLVCSNVRDLEFCYRGKRVVTRSVELGLGKVAARLIPYWALKV